MGGSPLDSSRRRPPQGVRAGTPLRRLAESQEIDLDYRAPQTDMELTLAAVLQEVLRIEKVGVDDNFFDLGASSLQLAQVHQRLQERLGREIPLVVLEPRT